MKPITGQWYRICSVSAGPTPVYINLLTLFVNIRSINDDECSLMLYSSFIC
jgi:hypothetical protein